jgi:hypothetical protein
MRSGAISQTSRRANYDAKSDEASRRKSKFTHYQIIAIFERTDHTVGLPTN